ncbi:sarcoplasmic reticulum histidine-rich calcium-binding protein [Streptomyces sp. PBH53]|uniref:calcium-binding protein n=1 Tax=Streptomyces TaxID=1883 RepID=UPI0006559A22|nr:calcium-binding protein [Streptomyces sp. PBH53]AKN70326.1 sarcoplasmic reticulum histidine-rich calcium-binding protein [Streptomyces sp. PBH53]
MRKRAASAVLGAVAVLAGLAVPGAAADETQGDVLISDVTFDGGKNIVVDIYDRTVTVSGTFTHPSGIQDADFVLWRGPAGANPYQVYDDRFVSNQYYVHADCVASSATTSTCSQTFTFEPDWLLTNAHAGTWKVSVQGVANDDSWTHTPEYTTTRLQRQSALTVNAGPEPAAKGTALTVTGKLSRANWDTLDRRGYAGQPVQLQFRKAGTTTYTTVRTVTTSSTGTLSTTVTAAEDGYWRWSFAGTSTTPAVKAAGDFVDVQ